MTSDDNYHVVLEEIDHLKSMISGSIFSSEKPDWKSIWNQIRTVGSKFKGTKFPTREQHQEAWDKFQNLVSDIKEAQAEEHNQWEERKRDSGKYKDEIIYQAELAKPSGPLSDLVLAIATGGISSALSAIMGPFDERKDELTACSEHLKQGWHLLSDHKERMLGRDKNEAYSALIDAKEQLDHAWNDYKQERQQAYDDYQAERQRKHDEWVERVETNIDNLEERRERLLEKISRREEVLDNLHDKLDDAWSDDYRDTISGWIDEEQDKLDDVTRKLEDVEQWLEEAKRKLNN